MRAFFSVDLPDGLAGAVADAAEPFADDVAGFRPVDPRSAHLTLKFLGDVDDDAIDDVRAAGERAVDRADVRPFTCSIAGFGVFPSIEYVRVVWAGIEAGAPELTRLHEALEAETTAIGIDPENHAFTPHVTLGRMTDARGKRRVQDLVRKRHPEIGRFEVDEVRLRESARTHEGPTYRTVERFPLPNPGD
ncbi:RNA 2',3'-cyclic phosphodiesterase [Halorubrum sp. JWXQ-INN 858]|uniref:RNA 2',3'-cyclic phosphodiesterase n=1 Tax=Halorubrum sp. JWXQ-INN 858 TaxID=2690782 RepID=UPI00135BFD2B|nr:RNA 2',3'-cyclic phosphodiesterase [Halorubrum sp. JWXQ-INN 858]MWV63524.1 RNA 2',3'-cyclic phosphodiesterase [Halorubrum sp. JWXQ-INN 858]